MAEKSGGGARQRVGGHRPLSQAGAADPTPRAGNAFAGCTLLSARKLFGTLVRMTRIPSQSKTRKATASKTSSGHWVLQDAKARFSELVRKVRSEGPQHVTVHGRDEVVVISAEEFRRLKGEKTGQALIQALQASPHREVEIALERIVMPVRNVEL